ncbi:MAG: fibronectin type III domain-containing protein [Chloroflexota bacterium]|nr:fibronectin type III domain-containing protein [Chloroflexota bacterium]MDE2910618.1 fibronectin type III domain-containing protein [Chloroflexota bacterium]
MIRKLIALCLVLLLFASLASAQEPKGAKAVDGMVLAYRICWSPPCPITYVHVSWAAPAKAPDGYRVTWTSTDRWRRPWRPNTLRQGTAIVTETNYTITNLYVPPGETLRIKVRALYDGERNGKWSCCAVVKAKSK